MSTGAIVLACVLVLLVVAALISVALIRRRKRTWERFAERNGLYYASHGTSIIVHGTIADRPFRLSTAPGSSDSGTLGVQLVRMTLGLHKGLSSRSLIDRAEGPVGAVRKVSDPDVIQTGDAEFDQLVLVRGDDRNLLLTFLTPRRRDLLRSFVATSGADNAGIADSDLFIQDREMLTDESHLQRRLELMLATADALDAVDEGRGAVAASD